MKHNFKFWVAVLFFSVIIFSLAPLAQAVSWWPLVPCGTSENPTECTRCDLFRLVKNIIDFVLYGLMPPVAAILFIWGGFLILLGGASPGNISRGKDIFWNTFMGVLILSASWLMTNTLIKSLVDESVTTNTPWYAFECREIVAGPPTTSQPPPTTSQPPSGDACNNQQTLAQQHNTAQSARRAPELEQLLTCIASKLGQTLPAEGGSNSFYGSLFTFDHSSPLCNFTRGDRHCDSSCSHATNSCHYGGSNGTQGSLAADFGNERNGDSIIQAAIECGAKSGRCENAAGVNVGCVIGSGANHVHISSRSCDAN